MKAIFDHRYRRFRWAIAIVVLIVLVIADRSGWLLAKGTDDLAVYHGMTCRVLRVVDGDTIEVDLPDALNDRPFTRVRLWGIDCPEADHFEQTAEPWAKEALQLASSLVMDKDVTLWLEAHRTRDTYARVLAHIEFNHGNRLNEELLKAGLATAEDRWPHTMLVRYQQLEYGARRKQLGIWSPTSKE